MRLDHVDIARGQIRVHQSLTNYPLLRWTTGGGHHIGGSVLSDGGAPDERKHWITEHACARQSGQHQNASAFGDAEPVRRSSKRLASAVFGQRDVLVAGLYLGLLGSLLSMWVFMRYQREIPAWRAANVQPTEALRCE